MSKNAVCLKVPKKKGETVIALASELGLLDVSLKIQRDSDSLCIPMVRQPDADELATIKSQAPDYQLENRAFAEKQPAAGTVMQTLEDKLPPHLLASLPQALDVVGDIAIVEVLPQLKPYEKLLGEAILRTHKNVRTVLAKAGAVGGTFSAARVRLRRRGTQDPYGSPRVRVPISR